MPLTARISRNIPSRQRMPRPGDSKAHLAFVRSLPCCVCGGPAEAHHLLRAGDGPKGMGRKNLDKFALPLCFSDHRGGKDSAHGHGDDEEWLASKGIDGRALAASLWRVSGDYEAGLRIVERARR